MKQYTVTGMSCAACSAHVEKAVRNVKGVDSCEVSLLMNSMNVEGSADENEIIHAVEAAGYGAVPKYESDSGSGSHETGKNTQRSTYAAEEKALEDHETPVLRKRLLLSLVFLIVLMYLSMGHMMWGWPVPEVIRDDHVAMGLVQMLLTAAVMIINRQFFISGFRSLIHGAPNMDTLVALGSSAAFGYSTYALSAMNAAVLDHNKELVMYYMNDLYFESSAMILTLITVGKMLEAHSRGKTTDALKSLMKLAPKTAVIIRNGQELEVPVEEVNRGDIFIVKPGETVPADGAVIEGCSSVNEAALTGESMPVDKSAGDKVIGATINQAGYLKCRAEQVGRDTALSQIIEMVSNAASSKAPIAKTADRVSAVFVPAVIIVAAGVFIIWMLCGQSAGFALARGISVLVISCPCALGLATPVAIMVGSGIGARNGILFKSAAALEKTGKIETIALDKTGTITKGEPAVTDVITADGVGKDELLNIAGTLEDKSEHPLAKAVMNYIKDNNIIISGSMNFEVFPGNGLSAEAEGVNFYGGKLDFISRYTEIDENVKKVADDLAGTGKTPLFFGCGKQYKGIIAVADTIKEDSREAVNQLKNMGIKAVMLTGDNQKTAAAVGHEAGTDEVIAELLPDGKERAVQELKKNGVTAMAGDGINDAPALTCADIGIAIGSGTDVAVDAADIVLVKNSLNDIPAAVRLSRATLKNIHENLFWAFFYNVIGIPLAAGVLIPVTGLKLNPMFAAGAMSLSSFCVVTNALRLNLFKLYDSSGDKKIKKRMKGEENYMKKTINIEGMMCSHCEASVRSALEAVPGVKEAVVSHTDGTAVVTLTDEVSDDILKKAVEARDYKVISVDR